MPSQRQFRSIVVLVVLIVTFAVYVTRGPAMTTESGFYKRTVSHMKDQARDARSTHHTGDYAQQQLADYSARGNGEQPHAEQQNTQAPLPLNDKLKARLREAEQLAKKSADDKYRALKNTEQELIREKAEREFSGKSIAGRKVVPAAAIPDAQQLLRADAQGQQHTTDPALEALYADIASHSPIIIFSKSYCPHSRKAKRILLHAYDISPRPYIVELDLHPHGEQLQALLNEKTGRRTVPNIMVNGQSAGGGDEMESLWRAGDMAKRLTQLAGKRLDKVTRVIKYGEDGSI